MGSKASKHSKRPKDEVPSTAEGRCCQKEPGENTAPELPEKRSRLFVQHEEGNPRVYADFGATLLTKNQCHRLVDVDPSGVAHSIGQRYNDEIFFFNGVKVKNVIHESLVEAIRDAGPRLLCGCIRITKQEEGSKVEKGHVYVRLGAGAKNVAQIEFQKLQLLEVEDEGEKVEPFDLPEGESFREINTTYELTGSAEIELILTALGRNLAITSNGAYFIRPNSSLCMYTYRPESPTGPATIVAIATVVNERDEQYCISGATEEKIDTQSFPDYMKTFYRPNPLFFLPNEKLFLLVEDENGREYLTPLANTDLYLDSRGSPDYEAILGHELSFVNINDKFDCTKNCTI